MVSAFRADKTRRTAQTRRNCFYKVVLKALKKILHVKDRNYPKITRKQWISSRWFICSRWLWRCAYYWGEKCQKWQFESLQNFQNKPRFKKWICDTFQIWLVEIQRSKTRLKYSRYYNPTFSVFKKKMTTTKWYTMTWYYNMVLCHTTSGFRSKCILRFEYFA